MNHTPGPWFVRCCRNCPTGEACEIATSQIEDSGVTVAKDASYDECHHIMNLADAKVMAAAPEMLTTLKLFVETYVGLVNSGDCGNWDPETDAIVMVARAVVSKAEGTSK